MPAVHRNAGGSSVLSATAVTAAAGPLAPVAPKGQMPAVHRTLGESTVRSAEVVTAAAAAVAGPAAPVIPEGQMAVFEYVVAFRLRDGCNEERGVAALEALWALQFRLPGCLYAAGGAVAPSLGHNCGASYMLHLRFDSLAEARAFRDHDVVAEAFRTEVKPCANEVMEVVVQVCIAKSLPAIFRKGSEWETGAEHLVLMASPEADPQAASPQAFLERLAQMAQQTPTQALQVGFGRVVWHTGVELLQAAPEWGLLARFPTAIQLQGLRESAPYAALVAGDSRVPIAAIASVTFELLSTEKQQSRAAPLHVTDN